MAKKPKTMKKTGRNRRAAGSTLLLLGLLVAGVWAASGWWWFQYYIGQSSIAIARGRVSIGSLPMNASRALTKLDKPGVDWLVWADEPTWDCRIAAYRVLRDQGLRSISVEFMLWPITLLLWTPAALLLRSGILARRRAATRSCATCDYSLAGLGGNAASPECGKGAGTK